MHLNVDPESTKLVPWTSLICEIDLPDGKTMRRAMAVTPDSFIAVSGYWPGLIAKTFQDAGLPTD